MKAIRIYNLIGNQTFICDKAYTVIFLPDLLLRVYTNICVKIWYKISVHVNRQQYGKYF